jgi:hypothetical protein
MAPRKRLAVLLALLGATILFGMVQWSASPGASGQAGAAAPPRGAAPAGGPAGTAGQSAGSIPDVRVEELGTSRAEPVPGGRNPFRLAPTAPPPAPAPVAPVRPTPAPGPSLPPPPPPPAPIGLKFIGMVNLSGGRGKLAVLSDGRFVYHGREGDIVEGRYRIVRIGDESIELEHMDGRGRQVVRLTGS